MVCATIAHDEASGGPDAVNWRLIMSKIVAVGQKTNRILYFPRSLSNHVLHVKCLTRMPAKEAKLYDVPHSWGKCSVDGITFLCLFRSDGLVLTCPETI